MAQASKAPFGMAPMTMLYQPYLDAYMQMVTETFIFATKMTTIAQAATQRTFEESLRATTIAPQAPRDQAGGNDQATTLFDIAAQTANLQNTMMRNAAEWQKQLANRLYQHTEQAAKNVNRTSH